MKVRTTSARRPSSVIPAKAGIKVRTASTRRPSSVIPAKAGMKVRTTSARRPSSVIPAKAGIKVRTASARRLSSVIPAKAGIHTASPEHDRALAGTAPKCLARQRGGFATMAASAAQGRYMKAAASLSRRRTPPVLPVYPVCRRSRLSIGALYRTGTASPNAVATLRSRSHCQSRSRVLALPTRSFMRLPGSVSCRPRSAST